MNGHCCFAGCDRTTCRLCGADRCVRDFHLCPPSYRCNCGESFPTHLARTVHAATCPSMADVFPTGGSTPMSDSATEQSAQSATRSEVGE